VTLAAELDIFVAHWFPLADTSECTGPYDESFAHLVDGQIVAHLSILYRVLVADEGLLPETPALHVALLCNAAVKPAWRGCGLMHGLKEQAHSRARKMGMPFAISVARWPEKQKRYGYIAAPNLGKNVMVLKLGDIPWPKGKVRLTEGDRWE
jgi:GNAT superfamily N-acetyltransferase